MSLVPCRWAGTSFTDAFEVKAHIRKHGAVLTAFYTNGRLTNYAGGVIEPSTGADDVRSGHSVAVIGWDDEERAWTVKVRQTHLCSQATCLVVGESKRRAALLR